MCGTVELWNSTDVHKYTYSFTRFTNMCGTDVGTSVELWISTNVWKSVEMWNSSSFKIVFETAMMV